MNFNLNISKGLVKMSSEKNSVKGNLSSGNGFEDLIASLGLDSEKTSTDKDMDIMELLQGLLSNIKLYKEISNTECEDESKKKDLLKEIDSLLTNIKNQKIDINSNNEKQNQLIDSINDEFLENVDLNFNLDFKTIFNKKKDEDLIGLDKVINLDNNLSDDLKSDKMSKKTGEKIDNILKNVSLEDSKNKKLNLESISSKVTSDQKNMIDELDNQVKSLKSYEELNVSTNSNKSNVLDLKPKEEDKDLNVLENILDKNANVFSQVSNKTFIQESNANKNVPTVTIRANQMADDFIKMVKYLKNNNIEEIKVNINPKELGDMTIKLMKDSEATKVFINVSKEDTFHMLSKNIGDINKHLFDLGIKSKDVVVTMKSNGENFFSDNLNQQFNKREESRKQKRNNTKQVSSIEEFEEVDNLQQNVNILA
ncbi:MAG: flagellar hook-length control protein FliK [Paraclostridium sordellii]|uniref:flagellar hook-length control protein FliK n=1 Tax=Paraclostridium sordellii TaxID=1505 RepID=UPI000543D184|nr:flagellar hook-length control protein FliK [Paeniclostridium sordellii]MDU2148602.1 flagellar hook-length control protein FliK [Paeniclostridium sordellii]MDU2687982.1 flagellar hook-length control protein FliK [Paeniclostridium sordellii]MVO71155.1 flagellar hook-length control protein FliK [Paeniclostridium sordellii]CEK32937.1 flagellar hook-length control protein FliK,Flagellar hook-length control protein FliK [[Clostridium] sordellii] [Paeniclostridium sordellii]CEO30528.1 flagellar ho